MNRTKVPSSISMAIRLSKGGGSALIGSCVGMMERAWTREVAGCSYYMALSSLIKKPSFDEAGLWGGGWSARSSRWPLDSQGHCTEDRTRQVGTLAIEVLPCSATASNGEEYRRYSSSFSVRLQYDAWTSFWRLRHGRGLQGSDRLQHGRRSVACPCSHRKIRHRQYRRFCNP